MQLRDKSWPLARRLALARRLLPLAHAHGARVLWNGSEDDAREAGCDGVHWTAAALATARDRPRDMLVMASCHTREEIARAGELELEAVVLGPVQATPTHPGAALLGWEGFAQAVAGARLPVFALGGLDAQDLARAMACGAHGVALRRAAWTAPYPGSAGASSSRSGPTIR